MRRERAASACCCCLNLGLGTTRVQGQLLIKLAIACLGLRVMASNQSKNHVTNTKIMSVVAMINC